MPNNVKTYDGTWDPEDHVKRAARVWFDELPYWRASDDYKDLKKPAFLAYFYPTKKEKPPSSKNNGLHNVEERQDRQASMLQVEGLLPSSGTEGPLIIEVEIGRHMIHRMYVDGGSSTKMEFHWKTLEYEKCQALPSTKSPGMLKFPVDGVAIGGTLFVKGRTKMCSLLKENLDIFAWQPSYMIGVPRSIVEHRLNIREGYSPVRQKKMGQAPKCMKAIQMEVQKLVEAGIMREVYYHEWLSNPVMVKKHYGSWRMCMDFTELNKACPQDCYPLLEIDWKVESLCGYPFKCFLDTCKGYHQIQIVESDEEKTAFHTSQGWMDVSWVELQNDVAPKGIKPCPDKTEVVLQLSSPRSNHRGLESLNEEVLLEFEQIPLQVSGKTPEAEQAFKQLKQHLPQLPLLVAPKPKEELIVYLSATHGAISAVLMTEKGMVQTSVYFRLRKYFEAHPIVVITDQPIKQIILRPDVAGRLKKWSVMLGELNITYRPRTSVKGQILADFLVEKPDESPSDTLVVETPQGPVYLRSKISVHRNVQVIVDSKLVANQVLGAYVAKEENMIKYLEKVKSLLCAFIQTGLGRDTKRKSIQEKEVTTVVEEDGPTWMTSIIEYLKEGTLPDDRKEASKHRIKARQYELLEGILYRRSFLKLWLRCVRPLQANYVIREIHEGSCSMHAGPRPFYKWGIDIAGPFPDGPRKVKLLIVAMDYFTKWIEAKAVETITGNQVKKFVWDNIVCRFGLSEEIVSDNDKQFSDNPFKDWCKKLSITQRFASVKHLQSNGLVERANRKAVIPAEIRMPTYCTAAVDAAHNDTELRLNLDLLEERHERAAIPEAKAKLQMTKYYNARVRGVTFRPGDFVYRSNDARHAVAEGKLRPKWEGPYEVTEALRNGAYRLRSMDGTILPRT
ncbi:reverse transcriptase domain-containing protein [Tanacetum coccineum]|uniref:Reverse transcriptase domain-containing protein n=1 Tax=Tanacetum coccineum TaxID=301880 RepID=A0ABQ5DVL3_9ASTR